jgi:hypothetical protein
MAKKDQGRKWMWWFLAVIAALQLYFVRELLAAFALFSVVFVVIGSIITGLYFAQRAWAAGVARIADSTHPVVNFARRTYAAADEIARRPLRRPGSEAVR